MTKRGRPSLLTIEVKKSLFDSISLGMSYVDSCTIAGISYLTFNNWMKKGEAETKREYVDFLNEIKKAKAIGKQQNIEKIKRDPTWQSSAWLLERQHPEEFGKRDRIDHTTNGEKITEIKLTMLGDKIDA